MVSHIVGGGFGVLALILCLTSAIHRHDIWATISGAIYGTSLILLYAASSIYHGLHHPLAKKVMQVVDHCTIYFLIAGTYTPVALCALRPRFPCWGWGVFGLVWGLAAVASVFTAIDLKRFSGLSMCCYIGMGWSVLLALRPTVMSVPLPGLIWLLAGGLVYTAGAVLYHIGKRKRYRHAAFHLLAVLGSVLQFVCVFGYVL